MKLFKTFWDGYVIFLELRCTVIAWERCSWLHQKVGHICTHSIIPPVLTNTISPSCPVVPSSQVCSQLWASVRSPTLRSLPHSYHSRLDAGPGVAHDSGRMEQINASHIAWSFNPWPLSVTLNFFTIFFKSFMEKRKEKPCIPIFQTTQSSIFSPNRAQFYMIYPKACQGSCTGC